MINRMKLHNFKCFDDIDIPLKGLTVLAGSNGSGKSTIIQALLVVAQSCKVNKETSDLELMGKYIKLGYSNDAFYEFSEEDSFIRIFLKGDEGEVSLECIYESQKTHLSLCESSINTMHNSGLFNNNFEYIAAERISPEDIFSVFSNGSNLGIHGENVMRYLSSNSYIPINSAICVPGVENTLLPQLNYWLSQLFNGFTLRLEEVLKSDTISLRFQEVSRIDRSNERRPVNVGFGITYILPVLVALLKAKSGDMVIIENPECHLHPKAQRMVGELMALVASSGVQLLVETHSDHVLNGIRISVKKNVIDRKNTQILFAVREDIGVHFHTNVYAPNILENGEIDVWPDGFFDEWDNALMYLLE